MGFKRVWLSILLLSLLAGQACAETVVKIGYLAGLTGDLAAYGQAEVNGAKLAVEEINAKGLIPGVKVELVPYDFRSKPEDAVIAVRKMIEQDKVVAIVGANVSAANIATAPLVNKAGVIQIGTATTNPLVTVDEKGQTRPYSFRMAFIDPYQGKVIAHYLFKKLGVKRAAVLYDVASDYSQGLRQFFTEEFKKLGGEVVADLGFRGGVDVDFRAQLTEIAKANPQAVMLPNIGKDLALAVKQARELGMKDTIFMGGDGYGEFMWEIAGPALEGTYWVTHVAFDDPEIQPLFARYREVFKDEPKEYGNIVLAYDAVMLLAQAMKEAGSTEPAKIKEAMEKGTFKLLHATIKFDEQHNPKDKDAVIILCKDGAGRFHERFRPVD